VTTLIDTSAWVEFLRATGSREHLEVRRLLASESMPGSTDVVLMELLAGARSDAERDDLRALLLDRCTFLPVVGPGDYEEAADLYRRCRNAGSTVRKRTDCLIAVVAMRSGSSLLHRDADFEAIAHSAPLEQA
jgi:predicted nucleic acid-binding protein